MNTFLFFIPFYRYSLLDPKDSCAYVNTATICSLYCFCIKYVDTNKVFVLECDWNNFVFGLWLVGFVCKLQNSNCVLCIKD